MLRLYQEKQAACPEYFRNGREDLLSMVPRSPANVLDVGCGVGANAPIYRRMGATYVSGIELVPEAAAEARRVFDLVLTGSVEDLELPFKPCQFDLIVMGDVLEHLIDPWGTLFRLTAYLKPNGYVLCSIPNVQHHTVLKSLLRGRWDYQVSGILDQTHLRFFTRSSILAMMASAGLRVVQLERPQLQRLSGKARVFNALTLGRFSDFFTVQFYVLASPLSSWTGAERGGA